MATKRKRILVSLPEGLEKWVAEQAKETGLPQSSIILHAIAKAKEQNEAIAFMAKLSKEQIDKALED